ncbi:MAG: hypothetical protein WDO06_03310 [Actinomycetota bacterium]
MILFLAGTFHLAYHHDKVAARPYFDAALTMAEMYSEIFSRYSFQMYDREISLLPEWIAKVLSEHWK